MLTLKYVVLLALIFSFSAKGDGYQSNDEQRLKKFDAQIKSLISFYSQFTECETYECFMELKKSYMNKHSWEDQVLFTSNYLQELEIKFYKNELSICNSSNYKNSTCNKNNIQYLKNKINKLENNLID